MKNWLTEHEPKKSDDIIGNKSEIQKLSKFIKQFSGKKVNPDNIKNPNIIISGPIGIGKSLAVNLILKENGLEKIVNDLSDISTKKTKNDSGSRTAQTYYNSIHQKKSMMLTNLTSVEYKENKVALVFDDISNLSNPKKKDAIKSLIKLNNKYKQIPIIIIANDKHNKLVGDLRKMITYMVKPPSGSKSIKIINEIIMSKPSFMEINGLVNRICKAENINLVKKKSDEDDLFVELIEHSQYDIRRLINILSELKQMYGSNDITMKIFESYLETSKKKDLNLGIYDGARILLNKYTGIDNALTVYSGDRSTVPLILHENYPLNIQLHYPKMSSEKQIDLLVDISKCISESDKVDGLIYSNQCWSLQSVHGFYSCVMPSYHINKNPGKLYTWEKYIYTKDYNKTSIKKINKKVIKKAKENQLLKKLSIDDFLYVCSILKELIIAKDIDSLCELLAPYKFKFLKEINSIISIDKLDHEYTDDDDKSKCKIKGKMKSTIMERLNLIEEKKTKKKNS